MRGIDRAGDESGKDRVLALDLALPGVPGVRGGGDERGLRARARREERARGRALLARGAPG